MSIRCFFAIWYLNAIIFSLLGFAAFAGLLAVLVGWALHSYITRIGIQIQKELSTSRDNRMSVLDELVKAVKYIKFFAWEDSWIERVLDTRNVEMGLMKKSQCPFSAMDRQYRLIVCSISLYQFHLFRACLGICAHTGLCDFIFGLCLQWPRVNCICCLHGKLRYGYVA